MKIYEIGTGYTPIPAQISAATEIVVDELTKAFMKQNIPVEVIDITSDSRVATEFPIREVPVPRVLAGTDVHLGIMHKIKRVAYSIALAGVLKKLLQQTQEKVVLHFHNQYNMFFFLKLVPKKLRDNCLVAYTNHSGIWRLAWHEISEKIHKRYFQEAECMKKADLVFVLNEETRKNAIEHLGVMQDRVVVINNGVNTDVYCPLTESECVSVKEKFGFHNSRVILQVGSVYENKGQLRSAEYLLPLLKEHKDLVFAYVGGIVDKAYQQRVSAFAERNDVTGQVRYLGMVSPGAELNELYNTAIATILPSQYEAFGLVAIEAMAAATPVLVDQMSPIFFGEGCLRYDSNCFETTIMQLFQADRSVLGAAARNNAVSNYGWKKIANDYYLAFKDRMN